MPETVDAFAALSDDELVERVKHLAACERRASVALIRSLVEFDARRLYLREGCSSLFTYCTQVLHLSEGSAYNRIETARAARRYPKVLEALERGDLTLTAVRLLAPHLTPANYGDVLAAARHRSKLGIQELIASLNPRPGAATNIRRLAPQASKGDSPATFTAVQKLEASVTTTTPVTSSPSSALQEAAPTPQPRAGVVTPLAPERYKLQVTLSRETHEKLRRAQALARHTLPSGDVGAILDRAFLPFWRHHDGARARVLRRDVTFRRPFGVPCGSAMRDAAHSLDAQAGAVRTRFSSSITSRRTQREAQPRRPTSSSAAARTTSMRRAFSSGTRSSANHRRCGGGHSMGHDP